MKHAILGAGAIGGLIGTALGYLGDDVTKIVRPEKLSDHPRTISLERPSGTLTASVKVVSRLTDVVDVLRIATKTYQMDTALELVEATPSIGVPLLNGVDHVAVLRSRFGHGHVVPATIAVEAGESRSPSTGFPRGEGRIVSPTHGGNEIEVSKSTGCIYPTSVP